MAPKSNLPEAPDRETIKGDSSLPATWTWARLGDIAEVVMGNSPSSSSYNSQGRGVPLINGPTEFGPAQLDHPRILQFTDAPSRFCEQGDLLVCVRGSTTGRTNLASARACIGRGIAAIRAGECQEYVNHYVASKSALLLSIGTGSTFPNITVAQLQSLAVPLPPLDEQALIVSAIEEATAEIDSGVAALRRAKEDLQLLRSSMLKAAVRGQLTTRFRQIEMEESGSKFLRKISDQRQHKHDAIGTRPKVVQRTLFENTSNLGASAASILNGEDKDFQLPSDWTWTTFGDICDIQLGQARNPSNRPGRFATPYLRAANITVEGLDLSDVLEMEFPPRERDFYRLLCDDLVISEASGSPHQVGKPAIWNDELPLCCFQNTVIRLRPILVPSGFVYVLLLHCYVNGIFASTSLGVGINHLGAQRLSRIEVIFPPKTEQNAIVEEVSRQLDSIRQSRTTIDNNLLHARELRESILDRAFQGKLVVPVISAEPASSLLERIKNIRHMVQEEVRPSRVPVRKTSQMTFKPKHRSLLSILREHPGGITPEELFAEANYNVESIDDFYAELAEISEALIQDKPAGADALRWPRDSRVLLRVKED